MRQADAVRPHYQTMITSSNGNIFRVTGPLCGEFTGPGEFPTQRLVTRSFDVFFNLRLNKRLSKQPWGWWFETPSWSSWRQCNAALGNQLLWVNPVYLVVSSWYVIVKDSVWPGVNIYVARNRLLENSPGPYQEKLGISNEKHPCKHNIRMQLLIRALTWTAIPLLKLRHEWDNWYYYLYKSRYGLIEVS